MFRQIISSVLVMFASLSVCAQTDSTATDSLTSTGDETAMGITIFSKLRNIGTCQNFTRTYLIGGDRNSTSGPILPKDGMANIMETM